MASRSVETRWLTELTHLATASGHEDEVVSWVRAWAARRGDLKLTIDSGGNVLITQKGRKAAAPVFAVAHMDHPAFVVTAVRGRDAEFEFRGGVDAAYFDEARVEFPLVAGLSGRVTSYDGETGTGTLRATRTGLPVGAIGRWRLPKQELSGDRFRAPACDDLAGCAAALAALDRARRAPAMRHFAVLLTRAEEVGLVGAIHAARSSSLPDNSRVLSIETSRASSNAPIGGGPIIRVGDALTIFDNELTNRISHAVKRTGIRHQRKLMDGGGCEASAFLAYGYRSAGLCLALGNWHNRGNLDAFLSGTGRAVPMLEEISLADFHGLVDVLLVACLAVDRGTGLEARFDDLYDNVADVLISKPATPETRQ